MRRIRGSHVLLGAALLAASGCSRPDDQRTDTVDRARFERSRAGWPEGVAARIDSGNAAYRAQDLESAVGYYRRAADLGPNVAAAWFGIYMVEHARGNLAAADSALVRARELEPGASLILPPDTGR